MEKQSRIRDVREFNPETLEDNHYTLLGVRVPILEDAKEKGIESLLLYGVRGDIEGFGLETSFRPGSLDNLRATFTYDTRFKPTKATHIGGGIELDLSDKLTLGLAVDNVEDAFGRTRQYLINGRFRPTENDTLGLALVTSINPDGSRDESMAGYGLHYKDTWGARILAKADRNTEHDSSGFGGEIIFAQNPTTYEPGADWFRGRSVTGHDLFQKSSLPLALDTKKVFLPERAVEGFSASLSRGYSQNPLGHSGSISGGIAHTWSEDIFCGAKDEKKVCGKKEAGLSLGATHSFDHLRDLPDTSSTTLRPGLNLRWGPATLNAEVEVPITGKNKDPRIEAALEFKF